MTLLRGKLVFCLTAGLLLAACSEAPAPVAKKEGPPETFPAGEYEVAH